MCPTRVPLRFRRCTYGRRHLPLRAFPPVRLESRTKSRYCSSCREHPIINPELKIVFLRHSVEVLSSRWSQMSLIPDLMERQMAGEPES